eukprot:15472137-Alexandrium_andersonii.AAC.1
MPQPGLARTCPRRHGQWPCPRERHCPPFQPWAPEGDTPPGLNSRLRLIFPVTSLSAIPASIVLMRT